MPRNHQPFAAQARAATFPGFGVEHPGHIVDSEPVTPVRVAELGERASGPGKVLHGNQQVDVAVAAVLARADVERLG